MIQKKLHKYGTGLLLPLGGVSNTTTVDRNETGKSDIYKSDRYGFKNPDAEWDSPQVEWLLVGDSFTHGLPVKISEGIPGQIRHITNSSVINLGAVGNGPLLELATLKEYAEPMSPRKVIWVYCEDNDLVSPGGNIYIEQAYPLLTQYLSDGFSQNLMDRQKEINTRLGAYFSEALVLSATRTIKLGKIQKLMQIDDSRLDEYLLDALVQQAKGVLFLRKIREFALPQSLSTGFPGISRPGKLLFSKILKKARERTEAWGGALYFVYLPTFHRYNRVIDDHDLFQNKSEIIDIVERLNIPVIDIHNELFAKHPDPLSLFPFRQVGHYTPEGYSAVAKAIVRGVKIYEQDNK